MSKSTVNDLAFFGGPKIFREPLHVGRPNLGDKKKLVERIETMYDRRWLSNGGPFCHEFERRVADMLGVRHAIAMCNATVAMEIAIRALGLKGEVIVPSFTFIATAHALQWQEITPVFADIGETNHRIDPAAIERLITPRTTGIIGVHLWGEICDIGALTAICRQRNLKLLFDAAHAFGCTHEGQMAGNFGDVEIFSLHATKFLNSGEGGIVATNDGDLAAKIRLMHNFGFKAYDYVAYIGTNGKMSEMSAAMGLTNLEHLDSFVEINRRNYRQYRSRLASLPGFRLQSYSESERRNFQYVALEIDPAQSILSRNRLYEILHAENVLARRYFHPGCHRMEPYRSFFPNAGLLLPRTEQVCERILVLPTGSQVSAADIDAICDLIAFCVRHSEELMAPMMAPRDGPK